MTILLLGGTTEARQLALALSEVGVDLVVSLAGATEVPKTYAGRMRRGGFGGMPGLVGYLKSEQIQMVIDVTHPFAAQMTAHVVGACEALGMPCLHLVRPAWEGRLGWRFVPDFAAAARALPEGARPLLATGRRSVADFAGREDLELIVRVAEETGAAFSGRGRFLVKQPPFTVEDERALFEELGVTHLVARNSGGARGMEKFEAAEALGLEIIVIERPPLPAGHVVETVAEALDWVRDLA